MLTFRDAIVRALLFGAGWEPRILAARVGGSTPLRRWRGSRDGC